MVKGKESGITENLKKGITELLILSFLEKREMHIYAITNQLDALSDGVCKIAYPYAAIYRLLDGKYIEECGKRNDEHRLRQFYRITEGGIQYLHTMRADYEKFIGGVSMILDALENGGNSDVE
ncbi:MAG: PadR family transcriptional regulator [Candidatus Fimenecus sp.]